VRELARGLAWASGFAWERLSIFDIAYWLRRACAIADDATRMPRRGLA
jgi:hypothetical protein